MMPDFTASAERFANDTKNHQMTVLHDDDVYRHLRCQAPDSSFYWFDIITWPFRFADTWEWDFQGIKWAIGQYDALKASKVAEVASL